MIKTPPVVTIDGPSGVGKGTIGQMLVERFGWHFLDSGALYRVLALAAIHHQVDLADEESLSALAVHLDVEFSSVLGQTGTRVVLEGEDVSSAIRSEECSQAASKVATFAPVREALLQRQRAFQKAPGLIADGRDMGTVVFPEADVKIFLTATTEERARRRFEQLRENGISVKIAEVLAEVKQRDHRDTNRAVAPLIPANDALVIDTTSMDVNAVMSVIVEKIIKHSL